jgi:hypothetical protein
MSIFSFLLRSDIEKRVLVFPDIAEINHGQAGERNMEGFVKLLDSGAFRDHEIIDMRF